MSKKKSKSKKKTKYIVGIVLLIIVSSMLIVMFIPMKNLSIGQEEIGQYFSGLAVHKPYDVDQSRHSMDEWMYYNYEDNKIFTDSDSTWMAGQRRGSFDMELDYKKFAWDIDSPGYHSPNVVVSWITKFPSDNTGKELDEFKMKEHHVTFTDTTTGATRDMHFYYTTFTTQYTIDLMADIGYLVTQQNAWGKEVVVRLNGEVYGDYLPFEYGREWQEMGGQWADFRVVVRTDIRNMAFGEYVHIDTDYDDIGNAVLWSKITSTNTAGIDFSTSFKFPAIVKGDYQQCGKVLYPTLEDALEKTNQIPDRTYDTIELGDTIYPVAYMPIEFRGILGCDFNTVGAWDSLEWDSFTKTDCFLEIKVTTCILTSFASPITWGEGELVIVDPLIENDPEDDKSLWEIIIEWLMNTFDLTKNQANAILIGVIVIILALLIVPLIPGLMGGIGGVFRGIGRGFSNLMKRISRKGDRS